MDHATLTDNNGRKADFRNVILIMTTNAGAQEMAAAAIGFGGQTNDAQGRARRIERLFSPEFRNRLDAMIQFASLSPAIIERVVDKFIMELDAQLNEKKVFIQLTPAARALSGGEGLRPDLRRAPDGAAHPDRDQARARRRDPLRRACATAVASRSTPPTRR